MDALQWLPGAASTHRVHARAVAVEGVAAVRVVVIDGRNGEGGGGNHRKRVINGFSWKGAVTPQKWMNFYTKVLSSLVATSSLKLEVRFEVVSVDAGNEAKTEATKAALRELGLSKDVEVHSE